MANLQEIVEYRGVSGLVAAEVLTDDNGADGYTTGEVFAIAGVAEISKSTESSIDSHYYDNIPAVIVTSTGPDTVNINASAIPLDVVAKLTGQKYHEETGSLIEGVRELKYFAIGYITKKTNGDEVYVWRYKGSFAVPNETSTTENDGTDAAGQELVYTGIATTHKFVSNADSKGNARGAKSLYVDLGKGLANVSTFFDTVTDPDHLFPMTIGVPTNVAAAASADKAITISWDSVAGATNYNVYRYNSSQGTYVLKGTTSISDPNPTKYIDSGLTAGTRYYYKVTAVITNGVTTMESEMSLAADAQAINAPAAPTGVAATASGSNEITVTWTEVASATQYNVWRALSSAGTYVYRGTTQATAQNPTTYVDSGLNAGTTYYYKVDSVIKDANGTVVSQHSAAASATAQASVG